MPDGQPVTLALEPAPKPADPAGVGAGRFASKGGPYAVDPPIGTLKGTMAGAPFSEPFAGPR